MAKIILDMALDAAMRGAKHDAEAAAEVLQLAAPYLLDLDKSGELPLGLGRYLANAFTLTAREKAENRPQILARTLHLTNPNRRPKDYMATGAAVEDAMQSNPPMTQYAAVKQVCGQTGVSESYAKNAHKRYLECLAEIEQIEQEEWRLQREEDERIEAALQTECYESRLEDAAKLVQQLLGDGLSTPQALENAARNHGVYPMDIDRFMDKYP